MLSTLSSLLKSKLFISAILASLLISLTIAIALALMVIYSPTDLANRVFTLFHLPLSIQKIQWTGRSSLQFETIRFQDRFSIQNIHLHWSWRRGLDGFVTINARGLAWSDAARVERIHGQWQWRELFFDSLIRDIELEGIELWSDRITQQNPPEDETVSTQSPSSETKTKPPRWTPRVKTLTLKRATLFLENLLPELHTIPLYFAQDEPIILNNIHLGLLRDQPISDALYRATTGNITLYSPYDALLPVISIESLELGFSWNALKKNQIDELNIIRPTLYIGPGLFWLADAIEKKRSATQKANPDENPPPVWTIRKFQLRDGLLNIAAWGGQGFLVPMRFQSSFRDLRTDRIQELSLRNTMIFDPLTQSFPDYKLDIQNLRGEINFSLPLASNSNNLVPTLFMDGLVWNGLKAEHLYLSVTFDPRGIYGLIGGRAYGGYIHGGFNIGYKAGFPWNAWLSAERVELSPITSRLTEKNFILMGPLKGLLIANGKGKTVQECSGKLSLEQPGKMQINGIAHLINHLPADWEQPKRAIIQSALESFQNYPYNQGTLEWLYAIPDSHLHLSLSSPRGNRDFKVQWHLLSHEP